MKFTKKTDYALRLMETLARNSDKNPLPIRRICDHTNMTLKFTQNIVTNLAKSGLIITKSGPQGGILLSKSPEDISILEIVESVEGKINMMDCLEHPHECSQINGCSIVSVLHSAQDALIRQLSSWNLKLMIGAKTDPFTRVPENNYQHPYKNCPVIK